MNKQIYLFLFLFISLSSTAQLKNPLKPTIASVKPDIEKVARDYYSHFNYTKGEKLREDENSVLYESKIKPQGATGECFVTRYKAEQNDYSWQAEMMSTEDFGKATAKYKQLFNQLNGASFTMHDGKTYKIKGLYDTPDESKDFAGSILSLDVKDKDLRRLKIEISLTYLMPNWSIKILVYEKEEDEDMRPSQKEGR